MKRANKNRLPMLVESYFCDHLQRVRGASQHTIRAYRDTLRMLLIYIASEKKIEIEKLQPTDLNVETIKNYLSHLESNRANTHVTRNCRLAAIRSFFKHLIRQDPQHAEQYYRVLSLPSKKTRTCRSLYLEPEDMRLILKQQDQRTKLGLRNHALLLFLYNTGARVSEALSVRIEDLCLEHPAQVRLHGKGRKDRFCPLWPDTAKVLKLLDTVRVGLPNDFLYLNARKQPLSRDGVAYILRQSTKAAAKHKPALGRLRITPHTVRHSCAVALLQSGVDITVIRDYLGHASTNTTSRYVTSNLQMKREALESFWEHAGIEPAKVTPWSPAPDVLSFLESL